MPGEPTPLRLLACPNCPVCGRPGTALYGQLADRFGVAAGSWSFTCCRACETAWLDPCVAAEDRHRLYATYYTHTASEGDWASAYARSGLVDGLSWWGKMALAMLLAYSGRRENGLGAWRRGAAHLLLCLPPLRDIISGRVAWCRRRPGTLLDLGCGNGDFLALMRRLGWTAHGIEPDPRAAATARRQYGLHVDEGSIEGLDLPDDSYDLITALHVIEHLADPYRCVRRALRLLRPGGEMVLVTPNYRGLGHRLFRAAYRDLDPPRHLHLLSGTSLTKALAGLQPEYSLKARSSSRHARWTWIDSRSIRRRGRFDDRESGATHLLGGAFQLAEECVRWVVRMAGDELILRIHRVGRVEIAGGRTTCKADGEGNRAA